MSANTWTVDVDGVRHTISVEINPEARRAMIRVDGRLAAKPLAEEESERTIAVGSARYVIRRLDGDNFDLDIPPEAFLDPEPVKLRSRTMNAPIANPAPERRGTMTKIIVAIVATLFVIGLIRLGHLGLVYRSVPWKAYDAPDGSFKVNFAGDPKQSNDERNIGGEIWNFVTLESQYRSHFYIVQYVDTHMVITQDLAASTLNRFFTAYITRLKASEVTTETATILKNPAIYFSAVIPKDTGDGEEKVNVDARIKGLVAIRDKRLFFVYSLAAKADPIASDREKFLQSFEVLPPNDRPDRLIASADAPAETTPAPAAPPVKAAATDTTDETLATTVARVYADSGTKTYWPADCPGRPANAYPLPKSLAVKQHYRLAPACAK